MFFEGIRSERQLMRHAADRLSVLWYLGYDLGEPLPDHSSLTRIRERYGVDVFRRFFEAIVEQCQQEGLVWGKELYFDGTKVLANASTDSIKPKLPRAMPALSKLSVHPVPADGISAAISRKSTLNACAPTRALKPTRKLYASTASGSNTCLPKAKIGMVCDAFACVNCGGSTVRV
jgi:Transposase domain (DUF772)